MSELKSAFITGAGGFIGRHLVHQLLQENVSVVALMMPNEPIPEQWEKRVRVVTGDVRHLTSLKGTIGAKARTLLNYKPCRSFDNAMAELTGYFRRNKQSTNYLA